MGEFEKDIRDMFVDLEVAIDTNELWNGIEKKLDKKDRKYPVWWLLLPLILLPIITYSLITQNTNSEKIDSVISSTKALENEKKAEISVLSDKTVSTNHDANNLKQDGTAISNTVTGIRNNRNNPTVVVSKSYTDVSKSTLKITNTATESSLNTNFLSVNNQSSVIRQGSAEKRLSFNILRLRKEINALLNNNTLDLKLSHFKPIINSPKSKKVKSAWKKSIDFGIGFALVNKSLKANDKTYDAYKTKREKTEAYLEAINANLAFNVKSKSGFFVSTGINYTQIDERFTNNDSIDLITSKNGVTKEITESDGSKTVIRSQKDVVNFIKWDKVIYNYYHFIDIPVLIGYSMDINNWKLELSTGLSYNIAFAKNGQIIGPDYYPVDISDDKSLFKSNTGLSFISNMKVLFNYKKHTFYIEPNIKYNIKSITTKENPLEQRYFNYGIKLGSRFSF